MRRALKILILIGSTRAGSYNGQLGDAFAGELANSECEVTRINLADYDLPIYNADFENDKGQPENAKKLANLFDAHDALIIVSPEYNGSLPPLLKNTIDWISRVKSYKGKSLSPFNGKVTAIASASPGGLGGIRMLPHLRDILSDLGMLVIPELVSVSNAGSAFDEMDRLTNERAASKLSAMCASLVEKATLLT